LPETTEEKPSSSGKKFYEEQIGPLPVWAWIGVVGAGLIATIMKRRKAASSASPAAISTATGTAGSMPNTAVFDPTTGLYHDVATGVYYDANGNIVSPSSSGGGTGYYGGGGGGGVTGPVTAVYTDNVSWKRAAETALIAKGYDPIAVDTALSNYINGNALDTQGNAIVSQSLLVVGPPPQAVPPPVHAPPTVIPPSGVPPINTSQYYILSQQAAQGIVDSGGTVYQSGQEAIDFAVANNQPVPAGINPSGYYPLSPTAARAMIAAGKPVYQSGQTALQWQQQHP
jgi:hypothetical protein